jgi:hypothetical protein
VNQESYYFFNGPPLQGSGTNYTPIDASRRGPSIEIGPGPILNMF